MWQKYDILFRKLAIIKERDHVNTEKTDTIKLYSKFYLILHVNDYV